MRRTLFRRDVRHVSNPTPPFPRKVSLVNWTTGAGNARYWVLKLLIDEVGPGDKLVATSVPSPPPPSPQSYFCGRVDGHVEYSDMTLACSDVGCGFARGLGLNICVVPRFTLYRVTPRTCLLCNTELGHHCQH
jgi:hypothetical protein